MTLEEMKRIKQERGFTMAQLSDYSGVPLGTLQKIFTGETSNPRYATRQALEKVLQSENPEQVGGGVRYGDLQNRDLENNPLENADMICESAATYGVHREKRQGEYTIEDYYTMPDDRRVELIDGVIYDMSAPEVVHQNVIVEVLFQIRSYIGKKGGGCIPVVSPVDVRLDCDDKTMVQPDIIIVCDRDKIKKWGILGAPEFVLEVLSKSTRKKDCTKKLQKYADAGVKEYWMIDPERKVLITYDFVHENMPCMQPLTGKAGLALYNGDLQIDLDELASLMQEWPE